MPKTLQTLQLYVETFLLNYNATIECILIKVILKLTKHIKVVTYDVPLTTADTLNRSN